MQRNPRNEIVVGAFLTVGTGLLILLLFLMGALDALFSQTSTVDADFEDIQSLQVGDPVYVFGMKVGKVAGIRLLPPEEERRATVRILLQIPLASREHLRQNSVVKIDKSLTGNISVLIQESDGPRLEDGRALRGTPVADLSQVTQKMNQLLEEGQRVVGVLSKLVREVEERGDISKALANVNDILERVKGDFVPLGEQAKQLVATLQGVVEENRLDFRHTVVNLKETTGSAKGLAEKLTDAPEQIGRGLAELEKAGAAVGNLLTENRPELDTIIQDVRQTMTNASNLTSEVKRRPWRLLYKPTESELKAMDLYDAAWAYNLGATELNRSIRDLASQLDRNTAPSGELEEAKRQVAQSLRRHREAEEEFWTRLKASE